MILAIDQGTTSSRAIIMNNQGRLVGSHQIAIAQHYPKPGWVEHDPRDIWKSVEGCIRGALKKSGVSASKIAAIAITNQRETVSVFDNEKPLHRFIVWQDRRTAEACQKLSRYKSEVLKRAGLPIDPYFSASKIRWIQKKLQLSKNKSSLRFRTIDSFLIQKLTSEDAIEATNASRTSLFNLKSCEWDQSLFEVFDVPTRYAPPVYPSEDLGLVTKNLGFLPDGIPVQAVLGDQQAALYGQLGHQPGAGKITYGTGSFILLNTGSKPVISKSGLVSTLAILTHDRKKSYALEGSAFVSGAWIQWLRDQLKMIPNSEASEKLARSIKSSGGVMIVPALAGMGAPFWLPNARGAILGLTRGTGRAEIARASLEALAFQNRALVDAMKDDTHGLKILWKVDGGAVKNDLLMQMQADILHSNIFRPKNLEATATGVALLAGVSMGIFTTKDLEKIWKLDRVFRPTSSKEIERSYSNWIHAVERLS